MTAPIASGWSESPGGTCTHWKAPPCHAGYDEFSIRRTQEKSSLVRDLWRVTESPIGGRPTFDQYGLGARTRQKKLMTPCISVIVYQSVFFAPLKAISALLLPFGSMTLDLSDEETVALLREHSQWVSYHRRISCSSSFDVRYDG